MIRIGVIAALGIASSTAAAVSREPAPRPGTPAWVEGADVVEELGARLPLDLTFTDSSGQPTLLRSLFDGVHPVVLVLAYYECPQLCSLVLDGVVRAMQQLEPQGFRLGRAYRVATVSFDTTERIDQAARKQASVLARLGHNGHSGHSDPGTWPFLVGDDASVSALTRQLGFTFLRDPRTGALAHAAVVFVLTPSGVISRYLYGIDYAPRDLKLALLEASDGKTGSLGDKILMRCFQYDPATRRYGLFVARFMKLGGGVIVLVVLALFWGFARHELRRVRGAQP
ncbi:MAG TPA: SCO family protein [Kofleriaceae bacterium]|jgi:protein SCO1/2|nr:SCO family protein [Kofleriaceae bacterium]